MTNSSISKWVPITQIPPQLYLQSLHSNDDGLKIELSQEDSELTLYLCFSNILAFQFTDEVNRLKTLNTNRILTTAWPFFITHNSDYIEWLIHQSVGITDRDNLTHYIITCGEGIIDILTKKSPEVYWI